MEQVDLQDLPEQVDLQEHQALPEQVDHLDHQVQVVHQVQVELVLMLFKILVLIEFYQHLVHLPIQHMLGVD
jgi:hypothetical protein